MILKKAQHQISQKRFFLHNSEKATQKSSYYTNLESIFHFQEEF